MPRLPPCLLRQARRHSPNLATLLPACRDIQSAKNELRWLTEYVKETTPREDRQARQLKSLCQKRGCGVPLQYILGSQPFGPLDIQCSPRVLIPRPETEAYTHHLVDLIKSGELLARKPGDGHDKLNMVDFCTGTGCIPLLLYTLLQPFFPHLHVRGVDIASEAVALGRSNIDHNIRLGNTAPSKPGQRLDIVHGDVFNDKDMASLAETPCDILISNPPYISLESWNYGHGQLGYSVRKYEPRLALVPSSDLPIPAGWQHEDVFYSRLLDVAMRLRPRVALFELGDELQARRVLERLFKHKVAELATVEVWRDWPDLTNADEEAVELEIRAEGISRRLSVKGSGQVRSILLRMGGDLN